MLIENWGLGHDEAAAAAGLTGGQLRVLRERHGMLPDLPGVAGRRTTYRFDHILRLHLAAALVDTGLMDRARAARIASAASLVTAFFNAGQISFPLMGGELVEMGGRVGRDPRVLFPLEEAGWDIIDAIVADIAREKGPALANTARLVFEEHVAAKRRA